MECYACAEPATRQCSRCARVYCELHGGDLCAECLRPANALPSLHLYRGSLLVLLIGTAIALWLLVRPVDSGGEPSVVIAGLTPTIPATRALPTPTAVPTTPAPSPTPPAGPTITPTVEQRLYIVQEGDTLLTIAEQFAPPGVDPVEYADQIAFANGLSPDDPTIVPGQTLVLP